MLFSSCCALHRLLSNTEIAEDVIEDVLWVNFSRDGAKVVQRLPDIAGNEVTGNSVGQPGPCGHQGCIGFHEGFVVPKVGDHDR